MRLLHFILSQTASNANHNGRSADTLYVCYCIDKDIDLKRRIEVFAAVGYTLSTLLPITLNLFEQFEYDSPPQPAAPRAQAPSRAQAQRPLNQPQQQQRVQLAIPQSQPIGNIEQRPQPLSRAQTAQQEVIPLHEEPLGYSVSTESEIHSGDEGEESQLFPGSDIF